MFLLNQNSRFWLKCILFERQSVQWLRPLIVTYFNVFQIWNAPLWVMNSSVRWSDHFQDHQLFSALLSLNALALALISLPPCPLHALFLPVLDQPFSFDLHSINLSSCDSKSVLLCMTQSKKSQADSSQMGQKMDHWLEANQLLIINRHYIPITLQKEWMQNIDFLAKHYKKTNIS